MATDNKLRPRARRLNETLMACSRRGGAHVPTEQKRAKDKLAQEVELSLYEDAFSDTDDLDPAGYGD